MAPERPHPSGPVTKPFDKLRAGSFDRLRINFQLRLHLLDSRPRFVSPIRCMGGRMPPHRHARMRALPSGAD